MIFVPVSDIGAAVVQHVRRPEAQFSFRDLDGNVLMACACQG